MTSRASEHCVAFAAACSLILIAGCGGGGGEPTGTGGGPPVATSMVASSSTNLNGGVGQAVAEKPAVTVRDQRGEPMSGVTVNFAVAAGGGTLTEASTTTNSSGVATVGSWTLGTTAGTQTVVATSGTLSAVSFNAIAAPGPAAVVEKVANTDNQSATVNTSVALAPSVVVKDQHGNPVSGVSVTFSVASGGGTITGESATTNSQGIATAGSWTLGSIGANSVTATVTGLAPATFTATGLEVSPVSVDAIAPATLTPGITMTVTGAGFSATAANNAVTIDGNPGTVTAASATELTVTVPVNFGCAPTRNVAVTVTVAGNQGSKQHPLRVATQRNLSAGESLVLSSTAAARCNELPQSNARYMIGVYNSTRVHSATAAGFELRGDASGFAPSPTAATAAPQTRKATSARSAPALGGFAEPRDRQSPAHTRVMEENIDFLRRNRHLLPQRGGARFNQETVAAQNVGDVVPIRIPKAWRSNFCTNSNFVQINARVAYVGTRSVVLEDQNNPMAGQIDTTYASIGQEFDNVMFGILEQNFGNPLAMDAQLSNTGKVNMVFSKVLIDSFPGIAGFVVSCDFAQASQTGSSNVGQYFYATAPTVAGNIQTANTPPRWRWTMRSTIIHEVKHITAFAERISRQAPFEVFWLEEALARLSEEMYERQRYNFVQRGNYGWGQSTNVGPYCGVNIIAAPQCALQTDQPRGFIRAFEELAEPGDGSTARGGFFAEPQRRSPLGRLDANDFSFYSTGWAMSRWMIDHSTTAEATMIKALIQSNLAGLDNLEAATGRSWSDMQPEWLMGMALDDRPNFTPANDRLKFPSWNLRDIFAGLNSVFQSSYPNPWPLAQSNVIYGAFSISGSVVPGGAAFIELSGIAAAPQLIELRAGPGVPPPPELRIVIVRVQ